MVLLVCTCVYPFLYVIFSSFSDPDKLISHQGILLKPLGFSVEGYKIVFRNPSVVSGYANTIFYVVVGTLLNLAMTAIGAFVVSRKNMLFGKYIMMLITFTMFFGGGLVPTYILMNNLHLIDTRAALIIPGAIGTFNLIIMRTGFMSIPDSLEESAIIDGANDFVVFTRIILPLVKPTMAVIALYYAVGHWNSWFGAMIYLRSREKYPLQLILKEILVQNDTSSMTSVTDPSVVQTDKFKYLIQYCTMVVATVPILFIYPFLQKYFVKGVMIGSLKE